MYDVLKRLFIGKPIASSEEHHQRLTKKVALAVFASDALSSTAYATEEILHVLMPVAAMAALHDLVPIAIIVCFLLAIVVFSYRQTILAYPNGGGSYVVSRENLGVAPSLVAGSSMLVDYVLTVAVSVSAGVAAITSAYDGLGQYRVLLCLVCILAMTVANLRGLKESGRLFAGPTYIYMATLAALLGWGLFRYYTGDLSSIPTNEEALDHITNNGETLGTVSLLLILRAFSSGAVALSGVEAISDGVPAFKEPRARNAAMTLAWMGIFLGSLFFGVSLLASRLEPIVEEGDDARTVLAIMGEHVFGKGVVFYLLQYATFAILILAANTAYADFPRLSSIIARDGFLPRQLTNRGDRLVFSNGIVTLAVLSGVLVVAFGGKTNALIPLYAVGVFTGFTLSQAGMVRHHQRLQEPRWRLNAGINGFGAVATGVVLLVVVVSKFTIGAWIPAVVIPLIVLLLKAIKRHYTRVSGVTHVEPGYRAPRHTHYVVVLVGSINKVTLQALQYARSLAPDRLIAVTVVGDAQEQEAIEKAWSHQQIPVELHTLYSPYRELTRPVLKYLDEIDAEAQDDIITVVIPEVVVKGWYLQTLHNQSALALKARLLFRPNTVVTSVPIQVD